jgi:hypothetical protein
VPLKFDLIDQGIPTSMYLHLDRPRWRKQVISGFPRLVQPRKVVSPVPSRVSLGSESESMGPSVTRLDRDTTGRNVTFEDGTGIDAGMAIGDRRFV